MDTNQLPNTKTRSFTHRYCGKTQALTINETISGIEIDQILKHPEHKDCTTLDFECVYEPCFTNFCNQKIILPKHIIRLSMPAHFDRHINIPSSVEYLTLGHDSNTEITLPKYLKQLVCGQLFRKMIVLGKNVQNVRFSREYSQDVRLGKNIKRVYFISIGYNNMLLPKKMLELSITKIYVRIHTMRFPKFLTVLTLGDHGHMVVYYDKYDRYNYIQLPESLIEFDIGSYRLIPDIDMNCLKKLSAEINTLENSHLSSLVVGLPNSLESLSIRRTHALEKIEIVQQTLKGFSCLKNIEKSTCVFEKIPCVSHN